MAQKQTKKAEEGKEPLVCTFGNCKELQGADGEFCEKHAENHKRYHVNISRTEYGCVEVEAVSPEEARIKAEEEESKGMANWNGCGDLIIEEIEEL